MNFTSSPVSFKTCMQKCVIQIWHISTNSTSLGAKYINYFCGNISYVIRSGIFNSFHIILLFYIYKIKLIHLCFLSYLITLKKEHVPRAFPERSFTHNVKLFPYYYWGLMNVYFIEQEEMYCQCLFFSRVSF